MAQKLAQVLEVLPGQEAGGSDKGHLTARLDERQGLVSEQAIEIGMAVQTVFEFLPALLGQADPGHMEGCR